MSKSEDSSAVKIAPPTAQELREAANRRYFDDPKFHLIVKNAVALTEMDLRAQREPIRYERLSREERHIASLAASLALIIAETAAQESS